MDVCRALAEFPLEGMPPGPTEDRIEITFDIDSNGLVDVHAVDTHSGKELRQQVDASEAVSNEKSS